MDETLQKRIGMEYIECTDADIIGHVDTLLALGMELVEATGADTVVLHTGDVELTVRRVGGTTTADGDTKHAS